MSNLTAPQFTMKLSLSADGGLSETARRNRALLIQTFEKIVAGDESAMMAILHPDVIFREAAGLPYAADAKGIDGAIAGVQGMFATWRTLRAEIFEFLAAGDMVIAYMMLNGVSAATGKTYEGPTAEYFRFRDSRIIEWWPIYWDTHAVREACGA